MILSSAEIFQGICSNKKAEGVPTGFFCSFSRKYKEILHLRRAIALWALFHMLVIVSLNFKANNIRMYARTVKHFTVKQFYNKLFNF